MTAPSRTPALTAPRVLSLLLPKRECRRFSKIPVTRHSAGRERELGTIAIYEVFVQEYLYASNREVMWSTIGSLLINDTSSGACAMRGFGAMCLLRRSRCMFLAPQCAALRCPWVNAFVLPVVRVPSCARGPPCVFVYCTSAHVQQNCTVVQYKKKGRTPTNERTNERTTNEIPFNRKDVPASQRRHLSRESFTRRQTTFLNFLPINYYCSIIQLYIIAHKKAFWI